MLVLALLSITTSTAAAAAAAAVNATSKIWMGPQAGLQMGVSNGAGPRVRCHVPHFEVPPRPELLHTLMPSFSKPRTSPGWGAPVQGAAGALNHQLW